MDASIRPPLLPFISDKHLSLLLPIVAYWLYSLFFHFLDQQTWPSLARYRIHPPAEISSRNKVTRGAVVRAVVVQQLGQILVGLVFLAAEADEPLPNHDLAIAKLRSPPRNLPNLASAEVAYWGVLPVLRQLVAVLLLDAW